jgi:hypothetical protein
VKLTKKMMQKGSGVYLIEGDEETGGHRWLSNGHFAVRADMLPAQDRDAVFAGEAAVRARWGDCAVRNAPPHFKPPTSSVSVQRTGWIFDGAKHQQRLFRAVGAGVEAGEVYINELYAALLPNEPIAHAAENGAPDGNRALLDRAEDPRVVVMPINPERAAE